MNYKVKYPSGVEFSASGKFLAVNEPNIIGGVFYCIDLDSAVCIRGKYIPAGVVFGLDPRAVIADESGIVVYDGTNHPLSDEGDK